MYRDNSGDFVCGYQGLTGVDCNPSTKSIWSLMADQGVLSAQNATS